MILFLQNMIPEYMKAETELRLTVMIRRLPGINFLITYFESLKITKILCDLQEP